MPAVWPGRLAHRWATCGNIYGDEFPEDISREAFALGERVVLAWKNKQTSHRFEKEASEFKERMRSLMLWRKDEWPYEYEYWKKHRGLE